MPPIIDALHQLRHLGLGDGAGIGGGATVGKGGFSYEIYLRPWGSKWPEDDEDKLPYYYNDWYLPLIEAGKDMPDTIGGKD